MTVLLEVDGVCVNFGGVKALREVSLTVNEAEMVGLIGPNGAGKSTLIGVLSGLCRAQSGSVSFKGVDLLRSPVHRRAALGMTRTFQRLELWESMTVYENVLTAAEFGQRGKDHVRPKDAALEAINRLDLAEVESMPVSALPTGTARLVEVARALASSPGLMLLDEPCAGLDNVESARLGEVLANVVAGGTSILLVEHHVDMVFEHCSAVNVLDFGSLIASGTPREIQTNAAVRAAYLGGLVEATT